MVIRYILNGTASYKFNLILYRQIIINKLFCLRLLFNFCRVLWFRLCFNLTEITELLVKISTKTMLIYHGLNNIRLNVDKSVFAYLCKHIYFVIKISKIL